VEVTMKVGFIGLGTMGRSRAANLIAAGHELVVNDARRETAAPHLAAGATWADTARQVAEPCEVVFTSLPGPAEVEAVALGEEGLVKGLRRGTAYFDLSTNSPALMRRIHAVFAREGRHVLDAPVSGGPRGAASEPVATTPGYAWPTSTDSSSSSRRCGTRKRGCRSSTSYSGPPSRTS
jgi:3-hydroxyisobutyrate dehydrogenase